MSTFKPLVGALLLALILMTSGCVGTIIGTAVDVTIEVVKIPFKLGGAVIDVVTDDDDDDEAEDDEEEKQDNTEHEPTESMADNEH